MSDIWTNLSELRLRVVCQYAIDNPAFRDAARVPEQTQHAIEAESNLADELDKIGLGRLDNEELAFCIGWAQLSFNQFANDADLLKALNDEITKGGPTG